MIITVPEIPWDHTSMWITGIVWGFLLILALVFSIVGLREDWEPGNIGALWGVAIVVGALTFLFGGVAVGGFVYGEKLEAAQEETLEDEGFSNVDLDGSNGFVASYHGEYFDGKLIHLGDGSYQVVELLEAP